MSPVPGGRSSSSTSRSPQNTSARNCCNARCSIGPRHTTGWPAGTNMPIETTLTSCARGGSSMSSTRVGRPAHPEHAGDREAVDVGVEHADPQAVRGHRDREVGGDGRLADPALAGRDREHLGQRVRLRERDDRLRGAAAQHGPQLGPLLRAHHAHRHVHRGHPGHAGRRRGDVAGQGVLERAARRRQVEADGDERAARPVRADVDRPHHAEVGDRAADLRVEDAGQLGADGIDQEVGIDGGHAPIVGAARPAPVVRGARGRRSPTVRLSRRAGGRRPRGARGRRAPRAHRAGSRAGRGAPRATRGRRRRGPRSAPRAGCAARTGRSRGSRPR